MNSSLKRHDRGDDSSAPSEQYVEFLKLYSRDRERLAAYLFSLLPNEADAEDVFQRVSLLLWKKFSDFDSDRSFLSWSCGVAFYEVRNFLRTSARGRMQFNSELLRTVADERLAELEAERSLLPTLQVCLERLSRSERELVRIAYEEGGNLKAYAEASGTALQTLYNRMCRIRRALLNCVQHQQKLEAESL